MACLKRRIKELREVIEREGCTLLDVTITKASHLRLKVQYPDGRERKFFAGLTPSDNYRGLLNFRNDLRRHRCH